jgi:hypothetical protein
MKATLLDLFRESIIIQSLVTLFVVTTMCTMYLSPILWPGSAVEIPESLYVLVGTVLGYWFKTKDRYASEQYAIKTVTTIVSAIEAERQKGQTVTQLK